MPGMVATAFFPRDEIVALSERCTFVVLFFSWKIPKKVLFHKIFKILNHFSHWNFSHESFSSTNSVCDNSWEKIPFLCRGQCEEFGLAVMEHAAADEVTDLASEADILMWRTAAGSALFFVTHKAWKVGWWWYFLFFFFCSRILWWGIARWSFHRAMPGWYQGRAHRHSDLHPTALKL